MELSSEVVGVYARQALESLDSAGASLNRLIAECDSPDIGFVFHVMLNIRSGDGWFVMDTFETEAEADKMAGVVRKTGYTACVMLSRERF